MRLQPKFVNYCILTILLCATTLHLIAFKPKPVTITYNVHDFNVKPENTASANTTNFNLLLKILQEKGGTIFFPKGDYSFSFTHAEPCLLIAPNASMNLQIKGELNNTRLIFANENPDFAYDLFQIKASVASSFSKIYFSNLELKGPVSPGFKKERNPVTHAINLLNANCELYVSNCTISGNFFDGIVATGSGKQLLQIEDCSIQNYGAIGAGMFGTGSVKTLHCFRTNFLRTGLSSTETLNGKDFGVNIYCHPNVSVKVIDCKFYHNFRNAIQFASGTALKYKKFPDTSFNVTQYQQFERNYFDSTCSDAIQLGFYYPNALIQNNQFYNSKYGIQGLIGARIIGNYFGPNILKAVVYNLDYKANEDDTVKIQIQKNQFFGKGSVGIVNCKKEKKFYLVHSFKNMYHALQGDISLGNAYVGDTSKIEFHSVRDTFYTEHFGNVCVSYNSKAYFDSSFVIGNEKFFVIGKNATGAQVRVNHMQIQHEGGELITIYAPNVIYADTNSDIEFRNVIMKPIASKGFACLSKGKNGVKIFFNEAQSKDTIAAKEIVGKELNTNFNRFLVKGHETIRTIALYNDADTSNYHHWSRFIAGTLYLISINGYRLSAQGNIDIPLETTVNKGFAAALEWNNALNKWKLIAIEKIKSKSEKH